MSQRHNAAYDRPCHPFMPLGWPSQRFTHSDHFARGLAARNSPGMRRAHHYAFQHSLATNQCFFPAFKRRQELDSYQETNEISQRTHAI